MEKKLVVGYDMQEHDAQLSFLSTGMEEPKSISVVSGKNNYLIPIVLAFTKEGWLVGEDALVEHNSTGCLIQENLLEHVRKKDEQLLNGRSAKELLEIFFTHTLRMIPELEFLARQLNAIEICIPVQDMVLIEAIYYCLERLGIRSELIHIQSLCACSIYYAMSQARELWQRGVAFFDFSKDGLWYRQMSVISDKNNKNKDGGYVCMKKEEYTSKISYSLLATEEGRKQADELFLSLVTELFDKQPISSVYLVGDAFYTGEWAVRSFKYICRNRRAFMGRNLYTKGACYAAWDRINHHAFDHYCFLCEGRLSSSLGIKVVDKSEEVVLWLVKAGMPWYEVYASIECIPDNVRHMELSIQSALSKQQETQTFSLEAIPIHHNRMTRLEISISFQDAKQGIITVKDLGFGEFAESSGKVVQSYVNI